MAGLGRRTFAAGEVLTAANVMGYLQDQAVMNFAGTAARGSAIASPSEGMVTYLADSNTIETYDGSTWLRQTTGLVPITPSNVVPAGSGSTATSNSLGLVTFTSCTAIELHGVFSSRFRNYKVVIDGNSSGAIGTTFTFARIGNGSTMVSANFQGGFNGVEAGYTTITVVPDTSSVPLTYTNIAQAYGTELNIYSPYIATTTKFYAASVGYAPGNARYIAHAANAHSVSSSYSSLYFAITAGITNGTIQVFGFNN